MDASDLYVRQAAKVFKHAVLHDARNLSGKAGALGGLAWNVNSAHEAKVINPLRAPTID